MSSLHAETAPALYVRGPALASVVRAILPASLDAGVGTWRPDTAGSTLAFMVGRDVRQMLPWSLMRGVYDQCELTVNGWRADDSSDGVRLCTRVLKSTGSCIEGPSTWLDSFEAIRLPHDADEVWRRSFEFDELIGAVNRVPEVNKLRARLRGGRPKFGFDPLGIERNPGRAEVRILARADDGKFALLMMLFSNSLIRVHWLNPIDTKTR